MAAIDLLFRAKKDSERLHQLVLGTLLGRTRLLARLLPLREHQHPDLGALQWEPEGNPRFYYDTLHESPHFSCR